jgi:RNA polymerase sigma-70 factor (ECF subfamily)
MNDDLELLPTRRSLLERLKNWDDQESWRAFVDRYWTLIFLTARKAGLNQEEAEDAVQETVISVSKSLPGFRYEEDGSFKSWLLRVTQWRIQDQFRKRDLAAEHNQPKTRTSTSTTTVERIPDPSQTLEATWEEEWEANLVTNATERVKLKVDPEQYQMFDLYVIKHWPVSQVAKTLRVRTGSVYLARHRIGKLLKKEIAALRERPL